MKISYQDVYRKICQFRTEDFDDSLEGRKKNSLIALGHDITVQEAFSSSTSGVRHQHEPRGFQVSVAFSHYLMTTLN